MLVVKLILLCCLKLFVLREFIFWNNILENRDGWIKSRDTIYYPAGNPSNKVRRLSDNRS